MQIYAYARSFMAANGNPNQWGKTNPPRETLEADIAGQKLYVAQNGDAICGVFFFAVAEDPTYRKIYDGAWLSDTPYGTIHRIASCGSGGLFADCVEFCLQKCSHLRIDTHADNHIMQHVIEKNGFQRRGIIYIADGTPRIAYERV
ncbi:MAG: N-acetyltransferase [Oscillospiraceae bacterium]|nr:N-acetyltransferase [Oscillospiraceae bacterium]